MHGFIVDILPRYPCISIPFGLPGIINQPFPSLCMLALGEGAYMRDPYIFV